MGPGALKGPWVCGKRGAEPNLLVRGETLGGFPRPVPRRTAVASAALLFCAGIAGEKAGTSTDESLLWLAFTGSW